MPCALDDAVKKHLPLTWEKHSFAALPPVCCWIANTLVLPPEANFEEIETANLRALAIILNICHLVEKTGGGENTGCPSYMCLYVRPGCPRDVTVAARRDVTVAARREVTVAARREVTVTASREVLPGDLRSRCHLHKQGQLHEMNTFCLLSAKQSH